MSPIEIIEAELATFIRGKEQAIANLHAFDGAIQAIQTVVAKLKAEASKAESEVKTVAGEAEGKVVSIVDAAKKSL